MVEAAETKRREAFRMNRILKTEFRLRKYNSRNSSEPNRASSPERQEELRSSAATPTIITVLPSLPEFPEARWRFLPKGTIKKFPSLPMHLTEHRFNFPSHTLKKTQPTHGQIMYARLSGN